MSSRGQQTYKGYKRATAKRKLNPAVHYSLWSGAVCGSDSTNLTEDCDRATCFFCKPYVRKKS